MRQMPIDGPEKLSNAVRIWGLADRAMAKRSKPL